VKAAITVAGDFKRQFATFNLEGFAAFTVAGIARAVGYSFVFAMT